MRMSHFLPALLLCMTIGGFAQTSSPTKPAPRLQHR